MKIGKILLPLIIVLAVAIFFSVFVVKEVNQESFYNLVIRKELFQNQV